MCRIYRVPPHKVGDYSQAHLANLKESNLDYLISTLRPWLVSYEQEGDRKLFTRGERRGGLRIMHDMGDLMRGNIAAPRHYYNAPVQQGRNLTR